MSNANRRRCLRRKLDEERALNHVKSKADGALDLMPAGSPTADIVDISLQDHHSQQENTLIQGAATGPRSLFTCLSYGAESSKYEPTLKSTVDR